MYRNAKHRKLILAATDTKLQPRAQKKLVKKLLRHTDAPYRRLLASFFLLYVGFNVFDVETHIAPKIGMQANVLNGSVLIGLIVLYVILGRLLSFGEPSRFRRALNQQLKRISIRPNFCVICDYDLKGSVSDCCPECGAELVPVGTGSTHEDMRENP